MEVGRVVSEVPSRSVLPDLSVSEPAVLPEAPEALLHALVDAGPDLTFGTVGNFRRRITDLLALHEVHVIVDLRSTDRLDAVGLGALVAARRRVHASQGCLHLIAGPLVRKRLASSGLLRFFDPATEPEAAAMHREDQIPGQRSSD